MNGWCDGSPGHPCGNPASFVARHWDSLYADFQACGKHLAAQLNAYPLTTQETRFIVVPCNPNVDNIHSKADPNI